MSKPPCVGFGMLCPCKSIPGNGEFAFAGDDGIAPLPCAAVAGISRVLASEVACDGVGVNVGFIGSSVGLIAVIKAQVRDSVESCSLLLVVVDFSVGVMTVPTGDKTGTLG